MKHSTYIFIVLSIALGSCNKDDLLSKENLKLDFYIESFDINGTGYEQQHMVRYSYNNEGKLISYSVYSKDLTEIFKRQRDYVFSYADTKVKNIVEYTSDPATPSTVFTYEYLPDGRVVKIYEKNNLGGINSEVNFLYYEDGGTKAFYKFSNGGSFEYQFDDVNGNMTSDKTTRGSQVCSEGRYTYDQQINPFNKLGYLDYWLKNLSVNNKLTQEVDYIGCSFPSIIPESFSYEYNDSGYPVFATTFYKSDGTVKKSKREYFYSDCACSNY